MKIPDIVKVLTSVGVASSCIRPSSEWVSCPCPFAPWTHAKGRDRSASFGVSVVDGGRSGYNCLSCKEHGNVVGMLERLGELSGNDYAELVAEVEGIELTTAFLPWESRVDTSRNLPEPLNEDEFNEVFPPAIGVKAARQFFLRRGLFVESMDRFDLRWDGYRQRVLFKVKQDGVLYGMSGRSILPNAVNKVKVYNHPKALFLLGEEFIHKDPLRPTVVIEGLMGLPELDACSLLSYANVVALQGSDMSLEQRDRLVELGNPVVLLFDPDSAGYAGIHGKKLSDGRRKEGAYSLLRGLIEVQVARWPEGVADLCELSERETYQMVMETGSFDY